MPTTINSTAMADSGTLVAHHLETSGSQVKVSALTIHQVHQRTHTRR